LNTNIKDGYVKTTSHPQVEPHRLFLDGNFKYDHINRNRLDYRKENLRPCNKSQNMANSKISKRNSSGYKGVSFDPSRNNWRAVICKRGKYITIGRYNTKEEAAEAYNLKAKELFGKFANLNVIIYANP